MSNSTKNLMKNSLKKLIKEKGESVKNMFNKMKAE